MILNDPTVFRIVDRGQPAHRIVGTQTPMRGGRSYVPLDEILPPPAGDMVDDTGEESDDAVTRSPNPKSFQMRTAWFQKFEWKLQKRTIRQQRYF